MTEQTPFFDEAAREAATNAFGAVVDAAPRGRDLGVAIHAAGVAEGRRAAMEEFCGGVHLCSAHRERQEDCSQCCPDFAGLVAEHRRIAEAKGRVAMLREVLDWVRAEAENKDYALMVAWRYVADAIDARFPSEGTT